MTTQIKKQKKPTSSLSREILKELQQINESIDDIYDLIQKNRKKDKKRRFVNGFLSGITRVFGVLIGTLLLGAGIFLGGKLLVQSEQFQTWISNTLNSAFEDATINVTQTISDKALETFKP